nr:hypothetical protein [Tanacetum cinerariifolium]
MDNKKHIVNLESFRDMLHICLRVHGQSFVEPPFEEEILAFIHFLRHSAAIWMLTNVNINKLYQPWRSFVKHKNTKKRNKMYYPRFTKVIIHHFMSKDPFILKRNKVKWHYVRDDHMFSTIKLVSRHQNTQQFSALPPIELTNKEIGNSNAYKEYYVVATGTAPPKPKASVRRTRSSSDTSITPPTAAADPRLTTFTKGKQTAKASKAKSLSALSEVAMTEAQQLKLVTKRSLQHMHISQASGSGADEETGSRPEVPDVPTDESQEELSCNSTDNEGADDKGKNDDDAEEDEGDDNEGGEGDDDDEDDDGDEGGDDEQEYDEDESDEETREEESFDPFPKTPENSEDEGNGEEELGLNVIKEEEHVEEEEEDELYRDVNINQGRGIQATLEVKDSYVTLTLVNPDGQKQSSPVSSQFVTSMLNPTLDALVEAYKSDKIILDTYGETVTLKRRRDDDDDKDEEPSVRADRGSKRRREGKEPKPASAPTETATMSTSRTMWIEEPMGYDKHALRGVSYWGRKRQQFYGFAVNWESARDVYSKRRIIVVTELKIVEWHCYKHLDWITMRRDDDKIYKFKEGNFKRLRIQDIEDMLLLL